MIEAVKYCIMQADGGLVDMKKQLKEKKEAFEKQKSDFDTKKEDQAQKLAEIERWAEKEREEVLISSEVYKGLGK